MKMAVDNDGFVFVRTIGVFGGSFNPPHIGHVAAVMYALSVGGFDRVLVIPTFKHAFEKDKYLIDFEHRFRMAQLAFRPLNDVIVLDIERHLSVPSYMVNTLHHINLGYQLTFREQMAIFGTAIGDTPQAFRDNPFRLRLIIGNDCSAEKDKWRGWEEIEEIAPPYILPRKEEQLFPSVSSTEIRAEIAADKGGIPECAVQLGGSGPAVAPYLQYVPAVVADYIRKHGLYR